VNESSAKTVRKTAKAAASAETDKSYLPPALQPMLAKLGIKHLRDMLLHFPTRYEDQTRVVAIKDLMVGESVVVEGVVEFAETQFRGRRQFVALVRAHDDDASSHFAPRLTLRYFNVFASIIKALQPGNSIRVFGEIREGRNGLEIVHPIFKKNELIAQSSGATQLTAVYPSSAGVPQAALRTLAGKALKVGHWQTDLLPAAILAKRSFLPWGETLVAIHQPRDVADIASLEARTHPAWQRVKFDELLAQQLALKDAKAMRASERAPIVEPTNLISPLFNQKLPFTLTNAQQRAVADILHDLAREAPMTRLLQGDVGSGKTIVAALAALAAVEAGYQVAFMAPTELLAEQHFRKLSHWLQDLPVKLTWLAGSLSASEQKLAHEQCKRGEAQIAIGTHALFQKKMSFARLGLVVVDEQHRFGVEQRLQLRSRGLAQELAPHTLMLSATPIPRSLAMSYYADLDVSVIDEIPSGRQPIVTKLVSERRRHEIAERIYAAAQNGGQAYWVCPLIEESDKLEVQLQDASALYAELVTAMPKVRVALLHGRMNADEKAQIMQEFIANKVQVLVSTTVIEVGVDVPNASWMVIEHAERFGLAQLHQLRGRVGRGSAASTCILLFADKLSDTAKQRLKVIYENLDGFVIAREDLRIRGPGELLGPRQSGVPGLRYANIEEDIDLVEAARDAANELQGDPGFNCAAFLERWMAHRTEFAKA
jgi:ATP-dependent DNA helicase RecG